MNSDDYEKKADKNLQLYMGEKRLIPGKKEVVKNIPPCVELDNSLQMKSIGFLDEQDKGNQIYNNVIDFSNLSWLSDGLVNVFIYPNLILPELLITNEHLNRVF